MSSGHALRLVLDTNVLLSGIAFPSSVPGKILSAWRQGGVDVVLSMFILDELRRVLPRLQHRHRLTPPEIDDLIDILALQAEVLEHSDCSEPALRDHNDLPVLGTLLSAGRQATVDWLITGDKDLLALADRYPIITPARFWELHGSL